MEHTLVIFDVEGTLVDCVQETLSCWQETLRSFGYDFSIEQLHRHSGRDADDMVRALLGRAEAERLSSAMTEVQGKRYRAHYLLQTKAFPKVRALFERLRQEGCRIALATSCAKDELRHYVALTDLSGLYDAVACGEDVEHDKPYPDLIQLARERAGNADQAVMVGDTPYDAEAARAAGVASLGVLSGGFSREALTAAGCRATYADPADLLENTPALVGIADSRIAH